MAAAVFENCSVLFELKGLPFKEKKKLKSAVTDNGGTQSFVVNKQCSLIVTTDVSSLSSSRLRSIQKYQTPVVGVDYVYSCLDIGVLLRVDEYRLDTSSASSLPPLSSSKMAPLVSFTPQCTVPKGRAQPVKSVGVIQRAGAPERSGSVLERFRIYRETDSDLPSYPTNFQVAKYSIFEKVSSSTWCVLELQSFRGEEGRQYRVVRYWKDDILSEKEAVRDKLVFLSTSEEALEVYQALTDTLEASGLQKRSRFPPSTCEIGSAPLQQLLLEEKLNAGSLSEDVGVFVELLWTEALGCLGNILRVSVDQLSLNDVSRAEGLLLQAQKKLREGAHNDVIGLLHEFYTLLPHREPCSFPSSKLISEKLDLCQLIRDVLNVSEMTLGSPAPSTLGKYRALRCSIETVPPSSCEFQAVADLLQDSKVQIRQVVRVGRGVELQTFKSELGNVKPLLHSSSPNNFVGILSRGLLLPRVGVEHHGIERTDIGKLGSGIYFSDALSTSLKYSKPSVTDGSRLLLVCDVALGRCVEVRKTDITLTQAPEGHHSVHGVSLTPNTPSEFEDDEYVVYSPDQVKLKYVVQFSTEGDQLQDFTPAMDMSAERCLPPAGEELSLDDSMFEDIKNPLEDVTAGLLDSTGQQLPLQAVHVKCKLMDLLSQVIIFQKYTNQSSVPIEAKYVFPLDDSAAVCGFEAFINGKHVVGQVKEKEQARKEYKQAIEKGHGAYLMDQDAPDVFTISVGNLPPGATVLIKVTFVSELIVRDGGILFSLPGSVAPWQESAALNQTTQVTVEKVCVTDEAASVREFTLDLSAEMPYEISSLQCITHKVKLKKTDCKAVVSVLPGQVMGPEGFQLSIVLSEVHLPRMWVEKHPDKDSQACMLVFYPDFEVSSSSDADEVILLLDTSESMKGESLCLARRIALKILSSLDHSLRLNVILFGTDHTEAFLTVKPLVEVYEEAQRFIKHSSAIGGSTELWQPLRALSLLPPSRGIRNLLLLSDGHIQNAELTLKLLRDNTQHSRLFTCGLSPTANRHMLRALAQAGGGAYEFFDTKTKHNWAEKVACQVKRMASPGCSSVSVKWQQFNPTAPSALQAPKQLHALFNDCHTLVYGFVMHCTQATLLGNLSGQELKTMVSTSELQKTRGTFLHKLTARAIIRDYEDGNLDTSEAEHEGRKAEMKSFITELSKDFSILCQFTSFVAIEERDSEHAEDGFTDIPKLIAEEDVDFLPYISWISPEDKQERLIIDELLMENAAFMKSEAMDMTYDDELMDFQYSSCCTSYSYCDEPELTCIGIEHEEAYEDVPHFDYPGAPPAPPPPPPPAPAPPPPPASGPPGPPLFSLHLGSASQNVPTFLGFGASHCPPFFPDRHKYSAPGFAGSGSITHSLSLLDSASHKLMTSQSALSVTPSARPVRRSALSGASYYDDVMSLAELTCDGIEQEESYDVPHIAPPAPPPASRFAPPPPSVHLESASENAPAFFRFGALKAQPSFPAQQMVSSPGLAHSHSVTPSFLMAPSQPQRFMELSVTPLACPTSPLGLSGPPILPQDFALPLSSRRRVAQSTANVSLLRDTAVGSVDDAIGFSFGSMRTPDMEPQGGSPLEKSCSLMFEEYTSSDAATVPSTRSLRSKLLKKRLSKASSLVSDHQPEPHIPIPSVSQPEDTSRSTVIQGIRARLGSRMRRIPPPVLSSFESEVCLDSNENEKWDDDDDLHLSPTAEPPPLSPGTRFRERTEMPRRPRIPVHTPVERCCRSSWLPLKPPKPVTFQWTEIFQLQHSVGYWELTTELGALINVDVDVFAKVYLKKKGIHSLGVKAHADILRLVATLLVLQLMRVEKTEEGKLLRTLFSLEEASQRRPENWEEVKKAVDWVCWADRQYPCVYSRLEFGLSWESATRQLLGCEGLPPFSPLKGLHLQRPMPPLQVH